MTAVEWIISMLPMVNDNDPYLSGLIDQAKEMEKQQQGYSEEEVLVLLHKRDKHNWDRSLWQTPKEWFEQFKNK